MTPDASMLKPGDTLGILGGGQLGRMVALAAARLGLKVHVYCPDPASPAFDVAAATTVAAYEDADALAAFAETVDAVTYEFENVPAETARILSARRPLFPDARALAITQDRVAEKRFLVDAGIAVAPFAAVDGPDDLPAAIAATGLPAILKTRRFGYDGKGQATVRTAEEAADALARLAAPCILEGRIPFALEVSAIVARSRAGETLVYEIGENRHENHILALTTVPAGVAAATRDAARDLGRRIAEALDYVGVLGVEMFVVKDAAGAETLLVNELAPRVHNSGHWTEDGAVTSQFENHARAVAGWPLGAVDRLGDAEMRNLIGAEADDWHALLSDPHARLHLYGKAEARPGRKMGHVNRVRPAR